VDENGNPITKNEDGTPATPVDPSTLVTNMINPGAAPNEKGDKTGLGNLDSGVLPKGAKVPEGKTFKDVLENVTGDQLNNAVNVSDLKNLSQDLSDNIANSGFDLSTNGIVEAKDKRINNGDTFVLNQGQNIVVKQIDNGYEISTSHNMVVGEKGEPGKDGQPGKEGVDGSIGVNGKDGSAVVINGKDGSIGLNGKDGKDGLTFKSADGPQGVDGQDGENGLPGESGKTRIVYQPTNPDGTPNGEPEQVATLNDGLIFTGNNEERNRHKLNTVVKVLGEGVDKAASEKFESAAGNINVKADGADRLELQLNKDLNLTSNGSVTIGDTVINNGKISGLKDHLSGPTNATSNVANATETAPVNLSDDEKKQAATVGDILNAGWNLQANGQAVDAVTHGNKVNFTSDDGSVTITPTTDGTLSKLDLKVNATNVINQVTGNVAGNTTTGKAEVVDKDGNSIANPTEADKNKVATVGDVADTINNTGWTTKAKDADGNDTNVIVNPGDQVNYTDGKGSTANITVTTDPVTGKDTVNVSYDVKAGDNTITVDNDGVKVNTGKIKPADDEDVKDADGNVISPAGKVTVADGEGDKVATVQNVADAINSAGWIVNTGKAADQSSFTTEEGKAQKIGAGDKVNFQAGKNLEVKREGENIIYTTSKDMEVQTIVVTGEPGKDGQPGKEATVVVGQKGQPGKDGVDGSIGVSGKDGSAVVINGKDGSIGLNGKDGANGLTIKGEQGPTGVDGKAGESKTRIVYQPTNPDGTPKGEPEQVATLNDGLRFAGNDNVEKAHKLNTVVRVKGEGVNESASKAFKSASGNINVRADNNGTLEVQLAKDLKGINSISNGTSSITLNEDGKGGATIKGGDVNVSGNKITNVKEGTADTDAVNVGQLRGVANNIHNRINKVSKEARGGIAGANAAASLPQVYLPGKSMVAASAGTFKGQNALAVGYSRASDNGKLILKLQGNANSQGDVGAGVGIGYQW
ncbi:YadA family autotransporter adhesin, partial [Rodentibacter ratti]|uniref:YadA family autotransporter adhesin n=1 Tax=Rodentibacter ratti TaxID=1906745 RepID=UPI0015D67588